MPNRTTGFPAAGRRSPENEQRSSFDEFEATELYCVKCRRAVPVRKSLLLILPEGDKYEYRCALCGNTVGDKIDKNGQFYTLHRS